MLSLIWEVPWAHYRVPGNIEVMGTTQTFEIAPRTTVVGALESMAGDESGAFAASGTKLAYGWVTRPRGRGAILRKDHVVATGGVGSPPMTTRPTKKVVLYGMTLRIVVDGPYEERVRAALRGECSRYGGPLYLGESDNPVEWLAEGDAPAEWLVPGKRFSLPIYVPPKKGFQSYGDRTVKYGRFDYSPLTAEIPEAAWI